MHDIFFSLLAAEVAAPEGAAVDRIASSFRSVVWDECGLKGGGTSGFEAELGESGRREAEASVWSPDAGE